MERLERQQNNINQLLELIKENPELEIVPMVGSEIGGDDYSYHMGEWGSAKIDEYHCSGERIYFKEDDFDELVEGFIDNNHKQYNHYLTDIEIEELAKKKINNLKWIKAIIVHINSI